MKARKGDSFYQMPRKVHQSFDYRHLSGNAVKLLNALNCQFRGNNNGDLTAAFSVMQKQHGFNSKQTLQRVLNELMKAYLVVKSRQGGLGRCCLYALTWHSVNECIGKSLEIRPTKMPLRNQWHTYQGYEFANVAELKKLK